jgi:hypothetical protein
MKKKLTKREAQADLLREALWKGVNYTDMKNVASWETLSEEGRLGWLALRDKAQRIFKCPNQNKS